MQEFFLPLFDILGPDPIGRAIAFFRQLQPLFVGASLILAAFLVFLMIKTSYFKYAFMLDVVEFFMAKPYSAGKVVREWNAIQKRLETGRESEYKLAVIEADSLLRSVLKRIGYSGKTFEEQTSHLTREILSDIDEIREAHRIRNDIAYDPSYSIDLDEARRVLKMYEKALFDMGAL